MSDLTWEKTNELFHAALRLPSAERELFLRENCGDAALYEEINELLAAHEKDGNFLQASAFEAGLEYIAAPPQTDFSGERAGNYKIIGELGKGGMGAVFEAYRADGAFERRVAVKVLPPSSVSAHLAARFERERQILANLNHPYIAQLFDGGEINDGTPYFVMELVRGQTVVEFCRARNLSIEERLRIFLKICAAVSYAHGQGIVHRDLKPSNILITDAGEPKLLDFGIAKFLSNDAGGDTTQGFSFLTPEYAAPEQMRGEKISAQTDIYSLGIILYELLTEARPYDFENRSPAGIVSVICESEPPAPSRKITEQVTKQTRRTASETKEAESPDSNLKSQISNQKPFSRALDLIVLKTIKKERSQRYESVAALADDIERFLQNLPVKAAPDRFAYRMRKFWRRGGKFSLILAACFLIAAVSMPLIYLAARQNSAAQTSSRKDAARRLTFSAGADDYPRFAPDGSIVFTRTNEESERLFVINQDGGERLLNEKADRIAFSPDGLRVAFRSTGDYRIYTSDINFSDARKLTRFRAGRPAWFPDGKQLLFSYNFSEDREKPTQPMYRDRDNVEIFSVNADGSNETNLTNHPAFDSDACVSPDGSLIAFATDRDGAYEIYTMNTDGTNLKRLTRNEYEDVKPAFSPDGKRIAFTTARDGNEEIYLMNVDGTNVRRVTNALGDDREPQFSLDGKSIVFAADGDGNRQLYIIDTPAE